MNNGVKKILVGGWVEEVQIILKILNFRKLSGGQCAKIDTRSFITRTYEWISFRVKSNPLDLRITNN